MSNTLIVLTTVAVNVIAILVGITAGIRWLKKWLRAQVRETRIEAKGASESIQEVVDLMSSHMTTIGRRFNVLEDRLTPLEDIRYTLVNLDERADITDRRITQAADVALIALRRVEDIERKDNA